jgi:hypothetical protein
LKPYTKQVRKTISFSEKRDKELIEFIEQHQDDFSYEAKQLMLDGLKYRAGERGNGDNNGGSNYEVKVKQQKIKVAYDDKAGDKGVDGTFETSDSSIEDLMNIEVAKKEIDDSELNNRLDSF